MGPYIQTKATKTTV